MMACMCPLLTVCLACVQTSEGPKLLASNVGDARVLIARGGEAMQLSTDHVPDDVDERARIEAQNPNPRMPLVRFVGETWRVGGLLALSRAFGDAYLKGVCRFHASLLQIQTSYWSGGYVGDLYPCTRTSWLPSSHHSNTSCLTPISLLLICPSELCNKFVILCST